MSTVVRGYEGALARAGAELASEPGVFRPGAGPADVGDDPRRRQAALFRNLTGTDPDTEQDWLVAAALDPHLGDAAGTGDGANVVVARIDPVPGAGLVHGGAFIAGREVTGFPPWTGNAGDDRGFDPHAGPDRSRVAFLVDYERGLVVVRQNPSHEVPAGVVRVGDPVVGVEQDAAGRVRLRVDAANPLAPGFVADGGVTVRGDLIIDPRGGPHATASVDGRVSQYPSWEAYHSRPGMPATTVLHREQNLGEHPAGPAVNLPLDTVPVGQRPERLDDWLGRHHPGQGGGFLDELFEDVSPGLPFGDPWYDHPLPSAPYPAGDGQGGVRVPDAVPVR